MKNVLAIFAVLLGMLMGLAVPAHAQSICGCPPAPPICASNGKTYNGECWMGCDHDYTNLYKLYDGPCLLS